ncbi:translation elongation factor Ts [Patescibacteria group bacterium]|nr:translation elongation factor Ts [Patescibacteria group bacterium]
MSNPVVQLREETGAGIMDCKRALEEAGGDLAKAKEILNEKGIAKAAKKADRATGAGLLEAYIHNGRVGVLLELRMETDFVAHSEPVQQLAKDLSLQIVSMDPATVEDLLQQPFVKDPTLTVEAVLKGVIAKVGENMKIARFVRYQV